MFRRGAVWWTWISPPGRPRKARSLGTTDKKTAALVDAWQRGITRRLDPHGVITAVVDGRLTLADAFQRGERETADALAAFDAAEDDQTLSDAQLAAWHASVLAQGNRADCADKYRTQLDRVFPEGVRQSALTPADITERLDRLAVSDVTKGRYRAAVASLCAFLVRSRWLPTNPMPSVPGYRQSTARLVHYSPADAERVLAALPQPYRALETLMYACGWELAACVHATVADLDLDGLTAFARGTKNVHRMRLTIFTEPHLVDYVLPVTKHKLPTALLFPGLDRFQALRVHNRAVTACGLADSTLHDWRHTYAVKELKKGVPPQAVGQMLGHSTAALVIARYGRWVDTPETVRERAKALLSQFRSQSAPHSVAQ